jgi:phosphonate transport system substrate-binding protein
MFRPVLALLLALAITPCSFAAPDGSKGNPLRVLLIPADGGTSDGTLADFTPLFDGITRMTGLHFDVRTGQSYSAVIEGMCSGVADIAWFGPVAFQEAYNKGCAELLAIEVTDGSSTYYSGLFTTRKSGIEQVSETAGHSLAVGSIHSASSFAYPMAMLISAGLDPVNDLSDIRITGSHSNSLMALETGLVDIAGASFISFERAVDHGGLSAGAIRILAKSDPIPNPPLAMHPDLAPDIKATLQDVISRIHQSDAVSPGMIRGYGGKIVDRYDTEMPAVVILNALSAISMIDAPFRNEVLRKSGSGS